MAKTTVTVSFFLFFFAVAHARFLADLTANRAFTTVDEDPVAILPETKSETTAFVAWDPEADGDKSDSSVTEPEMTETEGGQNFKSMTMINIRPINYGRFPRLKLPFHLPHFRQGRRSGKHRQRRHSRRDGNEERHRARQYPGRLMRLRNPGYRSGMSGEYVKIHYHHHRTGKDEERHHNNHEHNHDDHNPEHEPANAFVKIRKFLASF